MSSTLYFIIEISCLVIIVAVLITKYLTMRHEIKKLTKQNTFLRQDNIGLMKHNGELFDENQKLRRALAKIDIPDFEKTW